MRCVVVWRYRSVDRRSAFALFDQAIVSLGNFGTNLLLIRNLDPRGFGVYAVLWSVMLLLNTLQSSLLVHPLLVFGASGTATRARKMTASALYLTLGGMVIALPVLVCATLILGRLDLVLWILPALLVWQLQEVLRRALMSQGRYGDCLWGDAVSYLGQAAAVAIIARTGTLSLPAVFVCMAGTSLLAAVIQASQIRPVWVDLKEFLATSRSFWNMGRWIANLNIVASVTTTALPWALALMRGPAEVAGYQALFYVVGIVQPLMFGIGAVVSADVARGSAEGNVRSALQDVLRPVGAGALTIAAYGCILTLFPASALGLLFRSSSPYLHLAPVLRLFVLAAFMNYAGQMLSEVLIGLRETRAAFVSQCWSSAACVAVGLPLLTLTGVFGAVIGLVAAHTARIVSLGVYLRRILRTTLPSPVEPALIADSIA